MPKNLNSTTNVNFLDSQLQFCSNSIWKAQIDRIDWLNFSLYSKYKQIYHSLKRFCASVRLSVWPSYSWSHVSWWNHTLIYSFISRHILTVVAIINFPCQTDWCTKIYIRKDCNTTESLVTWKIFLNYFRNVVLIFRKYSIITDNLWNCIKKVKKKDYIAKICENLRK